MKFNKREIAIKKSNDTSIDALTKGNNGRFEEKLLVR